jgi:Tol biopolymer transport system component
LQSILCTYDLATAAPREVARFEGRVEAPNWWPDGSGFLVNAEGALWRVPLDDPRLIAVETGVQGKCNNDHGFSPDGQWLAFSAHRGAGSEIWIWPVAGGAARQAPKASPSWFHGWSPDGARIVYPAARGGGPLDIWACDVATGEEQRLTGGEGHCDGPTYAPDGRHIYYNCDRTGHAQIWRMAADGTAHEQLWADDQVNWFPHLSPDGAHLLYLAYPSGTTGHPADLAVALCLADADGANRRRVVEMTGGQGSINSPCWSPDGRGFAFMHYDP